MLGVLVAALTLIVGPGITPSPGPSPVLPSQGFETLGGFSAVVASHVASALGLENLPSTRGYPLEPGMFVTLTLGEVQAFDHGVAQLADGRIADPAIAAECHSKCPAILYDAFQMEWLALAVESSSLGTEIPQRVLFAAHSRLPARTLLQAAYAVSETRPVAPPGLSLVVSSPGRGMRVQPFFLIPPRGLRLSQGSAALGLTVKVSPGKYMVGARDPGYAREQKASSRGQLLSLVVEAKRRFPGKQALILEPDETVTVGELVEVIGTVRDEFPRIVLSLGQRVELP
jgi:hypothetical protein